MEQLWLRSKTHKVSCRTLRFGNYDSLSLSGWKNSYWFFSFLKRKIKITLKDVSNFATTFISRNSHLKQLLNCNFYFRAIVTDLNLLTGNKWEFLLFFFFWRKSLLTHGETGCSFVLCFEEQQKLCSETEMSLPAIYSAQVCFGNYNFKANNKRDNII